MKINKIALFVLGAAFTASSLAIGFMPWTQEAKKNHSGSSSNIFYSSAQLNQSFDACLDIFPQRSTFFTYSFSADMKPTPLCSNHFAVLYSKVSKTPLVSIEKLNAYSIADAKGEERTNNFYPDPRLKAEDRASLADYERSRYDRGHQAPAADAVDSIAMSQTFALSNMVPQDPTHNRKIWSKLEHQVRQYASRAASNVYVYTGPLFSPQRTTIGRGQVWVPDYLFKLVYDQARGQAWGWILPNSPDAVIGKPMSYSEFIKRTQLKLIDPSLLRN